MQNKFQPQVCDGRVFPKDIGRVINRAFELRQQGDYRENVELPPEQVKPLIEAAQAFLEMVKTYLKNKEGE